MKSPSSSALALTLPKAVRSPVRGFERTAASSRNGAAIGLRNAPAGAVDRIPVDRAGLANEVLKMLDRPGVPTEGAELDLQLTIRTRRGYSLKRRAFTLKD